MLNDLVTTKEKVMEGDKLISAFLINLSHEIRTPMSGILGFAELLKEPDLSAEDFTECIANLEKSGKRMLNILNDIINLSKLESGLVDIKMKESNINSQLAGIYNSFKQEAGKKGLEIFYKNGLTDEEATVRADWHKIHTVLTHLVDNAIKFTEQGSIEIGYEKKREYFEFYVRDTGIGIPKEYLPIIFKRFRQASESLSREYEGAGLGLSISKAFVEMLGGKIWVNSQPGGGSVFYFTIPYNGEAEKHFAIQDVYLGNSAEHHN